MQKKKRSAARHILKKFVFDLFDLLLNNYLSTCRNVSTVEPVYEDHST